MEQLEALVALLSLLYLEVLSVEELSTLHQILFFLQVLLELKVMTSWKKLYLDEKELVSFLS